MRAVGGGTSSHMPHTDLLNTVSVSDCLRTSRPKTEWLKAATNTVYLSVCGSGVPEWPDLLAPALCGS